MSIKRLSLELRKRKVLFLFWLSALMTLAGVVNLGWSRFFFAIPFVVILLSIAVRHGRKYRVAALCVLLISSTLYGLRISGSPVFFPAIGETITVTKPLCLSKLGEGEYLHAYTPFNDSCSSSVLLSQPVARIQSGAVFTITDTVVSNPSFGEVYHFVFETDYGRVKVAPSYGFTEDSLVNEDGLAIKESDLWRSAFYYPSFLMAYLLVPFIIVLP